MLELRHLCVRYGPIEAVHDLSFDVAAGQLVTIVGPNGAGKTSTMMAISGVVPTSSGEIIFEAKKLNGLGSHQIYRMGIVQVPEGRMILSSMSVLENLRLGADFGIGTAKIADRLEKSLELFPELGRRLRDRAGILSGGQMQMLAIARGLMADPKLLMLDEPSLGLAPKLAEQLFKIIARLREAGLTVLLVEQNVHAALALADHAILLEAGRVRNAGEPRGIMNSDSIRHAYLGDSAPLRSSRAACAPIHLKG